MNRFERLPAGRRVELALEDLSKGEWTPRAYWLAAAATRLRDLGLPIPPSLAPPKEPEMALYSALCDEVGEGAYYRYNSMRQELASLVSAMEARQAFESLRGRRGKGSFSRSLSDLRDDRGSDRTTA